ncbi:hypothetical protein BDR07DRAFT_446529 [Suillus spraguei]|nr:hypothetical protein BDR07DRAFT_446529 [Suillus spraguei]
MAPHTRARTDLIYEDYHLCETGACKCLTHFRPHPLELFLELPLDILQPSAIIDQDYQALTTDKTIVVTMDGRQHSVSPYRLPSQFQYSIGNHAGTPPGPRQCQRKRAWASMGNSSSSRISL